MHRDAKCVCVTIQDNVVCEKETNYDRCHLDSVAIGRALSLFALHVWEVFLKKIVDRTPKL